MTHIVPTVRRFTTDADDRSVPLGDRRIWITPAVEASEGGPLSAYSAHFGRSERAELSAPYEEVWVVLRGELRVTGGSSELLVHAGEFLHVPEDSPGQVEAMVDTDLVCVSVPAH
ncbi:cupin domain-containing protein [Nesterenkonia xinjiangensis]|uniref:Mannose-6-phosphate isomerase-like protein (Cupin superfamily) n=1 Tax=Nesterenkonia xinjiangensis TaxID=225327 RepID=A0A7Z0K9T3_9MICC|nr:cupin domain-containing protein [Nesterenkonia xinjiangensis]NYJ77570.1 mannose-6-phosphate isomerase-like protein (cupin superfamily) [Nesterenkonia xinjiangensis]